MTEPYEFVCCECRQRIIAATGKQQAPFDLCLQCLSLPGWFNDPKLAELLHYRPVTGERDG
jgi:hypothetical protein